MEHKLAYPLLLPVGLLLIVGYLFGVLANRVKLPRITGYVVAGVLLSPSVTGLLDAGLTQSYLGLVSALALSVVAYAIGGSLHLPRLKALGKPILWITLTQGFGALVFTAVTVYLIGRCSSLLPFGPDSLLSAVLLLGAISAATAPATALAVLHELRAAGPVTSTFLGVVALDDALTLVFFSGAVAIAHFLGAQGSLPHMALLNGGREIAGAVALGGLAGGLLPYLFRKQRRAEIHLVAMFGTIFLLSGAAFELGCSPLLANMTMGFVAVNRMKNADEMLDQLETVEEPLYCLFFSLAGAHFDLGVLNTSAGLGAALLLSRFAGKLVGTRIGARLSGAPPQIAKYLGVTLLPQAGLSLGLIFMARPVLSPQTYEVLLNAVLASVILNELIAPPIVKWALKRAGEAREEAA